MITYSHTGVPEAYKNLVAISYRCSCAISKAGNNGKNGYSIEGLVAKVKGTVANG